MAGLSLVLAPTMEPVTLADAKLFARGREDTLEDALFEELIVTARLKAEEYLNQAFLTQTWDYFLDYFPPSDVPLCIPRAPVLSVTSVKYTPTGAAPVTVSASDYYTDTSRDRRGRVREARILPVVGKVWPGDVLRVANGVEVRYQAGYGPTDASVPTHIMLGLKRLVSYWYTNRDCIGDIPDEIGAILSNTIGTFAYA